MARNGTTSAIDISTAATLEPGGVAATKVLPVAHGPLSVAFKLLYGIGQFVDGISNIALPYFAFFYLTAVCGLSGTLAGVSMLIALAVDAIADPLIGLISDNTRSSLGRRHPYLLGSIIPAAIALGLLFSVPTSFSGWGLFVYVTAILIILRISLSLYNLPYIALGAEISDDYAERSVIAAYRIFFAMIANLGCFALGLGVFLKGAQGTLNRAAYVPFGWTSAVIMAIGGLICALGTRAAIPGLHVATGRSGTIVRQFLRELGEIFRNRSFVLLFCAALVFFIGQGAAASLMLHANRYFWNLPAAVMQYIVFGLALGPLVGLPLTVFASRYMEKRGIAIAGLVIFCVCQFSAPVFEILGWMPRDGVLRYGLLVGNASLMGAAQTAAAVGFYSMMADATDEHELLFGARREALFFAGLTLAIKSATGLGSFIAGAALDFIRFPAALAAKGSQLDLGPEIVRNLGIISGPLPALITIAGGGLLLGYRLNKAKHAAVQAALKLR